MLAEFIGLYRGRTVGEAELICVCSEERIVRRFFEQLIEERNDYTGEPDQPLSVVRDADDEASE